MQRLRATRADFAVAGAVLVATIATMQAADGQDGREPLDALAYLLLAIGPVCLIWVRRNPPLILALTLPPALLFWSLDYARGPVFLALVVAIVAAIVDGHRLAAYLALATSFIGFMPVDVLFGGGRSPDLPKLLAFASWWLLLAAAGEGLRVRRERAGERERARRQEAERRVDEERLRIARELHDVLAHNVSLINVQASVGLHVLARRPEQAESSLAAIKQASAETLRELRSVLGALRDDGHAPRAPAPRLARLDELVANADLAGLRVSCEVEGSPRPLPAGVDLAAFRIVQEALTNVGRHAPGARAQVRVAYGADALELRVDDDGPGLGGSLEAGNCITGMRERVAALEGSLEIGARPGGGLRVFASLPLQRDDALPGADKASR